MTVSARTAKFSLQSVNRGLVDVRGPSPVRAGTVTFDHADVVSGWHTHDLHQIEYAFDGVAEVETAHGRYLLPPQRAMWIPAGCSHSTTLHRVRSIAVFFEPAMVPDADGRARALAAAPVLREMMVYATRWPIARTTNDPAADVFFEALAVVTRECLAHEIPLSLPTSDDPIVGAAMEWARTHLAGATASRAARAIGTSERTLRRRFRSRTTTTWHEYLVASRVLASMPLLLDPHRTVTGVAVAVGFDSPSAFARAFRRYADESPSEYRRRSSEPPP